jgi:hypothetical protein
VSFTATSTSLLTLVNVTVTLVDSVFEDLDLGNSAAISAINSSLFLHNVTVQSVPTALFTSGPIICLSGRILRLRWLANRWPFHLFICLSVCLSSLHLSTLLSCLWRPRLVRREALGVHTIQCRQGQPRCPKNAFWSTFLTLNLQFHMILQLRR